MTATQSNELFGDEHVRRYRETDGEVGHIWRNGSTIALLTTKGRRSGEDRTHALIYGSDGGDTIAVVASKGGSDDHPAWYLNLKSEPEVKVQVLDDVYRATARDADESEREHWWPIMTDQWPAYDEYQEKTDRRIPVVLLERR